MIVAPVLPAVTTKTQIKAAAYVAFQVGPEFPQSIIDEAAQERNGWPTKARIEARAHKLGLLKQQREIAGANARYIDQLKATQRIATADQAEAIAWAIRQLEGAHVADPQV